MIVVVVAVVVTVVVMAVAVGVTVGMDMVVYIVCSPHAVGRSEAYPSASWP